MGCRVPPAAASPLADLFRGGSSLVVAYRYRGSFGGGVLVADGDESRRALRMVVVTPLVGPPCTMALWPPWWWWEVTGGGSGATAWGTDLHGGGRDNTTRCSDKIPAWHFWLWWSSWLGRGGPRGVLLLLSE
jgi:hypothetical protein